MHECSTDAQSTLLAATASRTGPDQPIVTADPVKANSIGPTIPGRYTDLNLANTANDLGRLLRAAFMAPEALLDKDGQGAIQTVLYFGRHKLDEIQNELELRFQVLVLAEPERDLNCLLTVLDWIDGDADLEPEAGREDRDFGPSLEAGGRDDACGQIAWAAGGDSDREIEIR